MAKSCLQFCFRFRGYYVNGKNKQLFYLCYSLLAQDYFQFKKILLAQVSAQCRLVKLYNKVLMTIRYLVIANPAGGFKPRRWLDKTFKNKAAVFFNRRQGLQPLTGLLRK